MVTGRLEVCDVKAGDKSDKGSDSTQTQLQVVTKKKDLTRGNKENKSLKRDLLQKGDVEGERRKKKSKLTAYISFSLWMQFRLAKKLGPDASTDDIANGIESYWRHMNEEDRCSWEKARFIGPSSIDPSTKQETSEIQSVSNSSSIPTERTNKNKPKNSDTIKRTNENKKPKRPVTAYIFFAKKMRSLIQSSNPEMTGLDITKEIAKLWSRTEENERVPYDKLEAKSRKNYFKEMKQWREDREDRISFSELNRKKQSLTVGIDLTKEESDKPNSKLQEKPKQRSTDPPVHKHAGQSAGQQRSNAAFDQHSDQHHSMGYQHPPYSHSNQYMMNPTHIPPFQYGQGAHMGNPSTMSYHGPNVPNFNGPMSGPPMNVPPMNVPPMNVPAPISYYSNLNSGPASHNFPHNP